MGWGFFLPDIHTQPTRLLCLLFSVCLVIELAFFGGKRGARWEGNDGSNSIYPGFLLRRLL